ncbi:MAG: TRAP transporter large permease [Methylobacteriaceae bacterium]|jgi:C4-dicarboxylate transporter DctM subunit|nr:TRAP transporter large permease [Methylobacteriaceae bacterium]
MIGIALLVGFALFLFLGVPVGFSLGLSSLAVIIAKGLPWPLLDQRLFTPLNSFPLMAIPLFMLAGSLMGHGGITKRLIDFTLAFVGNMRGSLSHVVAITGVLMGGISGSGVADTAALGTIMTPEMTRRKYDLGFSAALIAASGSLGLIIPPSIAIIIYGVVTGSSIGDLFLAAVVPGVMIGLGFLGYSFYEAARMGYPKEGTVSAAEKWRRFRDALWALVMPVIIIFGIRRGVFTATEGGAVVAVYALFVGMVVYREIEVKDLPYICFEAAVTTAAIAVVIAATSLFSWLLTSEQIPQRVTKLLLGLSDNKYVILLIINLILLVVGMFLDSSPAIMLFAPILFPAASALGVHPVQFGLIMVINVTIGLLTPPVGTALFVSSNISGVGLLELSKKMIPFWIIMFTVLMLITYVPGLTTGVVKT